MRLEWDQTAALLALIYNANRSKRSKAKKPKDFHPLKERPQKPLTKAENKRNFGMLRRLLEDSIKGDGSMKVVKLKGKRPSCSPSATK